MDEFDPKPEDRFTFGLWTVGNVGRDPFGAPVRPPMSPAHIVRRLAECGAFGVNLHDEDLVPFGTPTSERDHIVREFKAVLEECGMAVPMATTNLFSHPAFRDGAFTSNDPAVRAFDRDPEVREIIEERSDDLLDPLMASYSPENAARLRAAGIDMESLAVRGLRYERLDQLLTEHLLGVIR